MLSGYWIFGPVQDGVLVLLTPVLILLSFAIARSAGWLDGLIAFGLALAVGHYLPGILRAYGDRALFQRFRTRLIAAPLIFFALSTWFAYRDLHSIILLQMLWGAWHWMMQVYGFSRIYDARSKMVAAMSPRLEQALCAMWFGMCVFVLNGGLPAYVQKFYESGGPLLPADGLRWFGRMWIVGTAAVTLVYAYRTVVSMRKGQWPNPLKLAFIVMSFAYLKFTASQIERPVVGLVLFESWHDIQYLAIVWFFNMNRARNNPEAGRFIRSFFQPGLVFISIYVGMCLAFGSLSHAWRLFDDATFARIAISIVTATALLHYYLDGFIWKIRENETRRALDVDDARPKDAAAPRIAPQRWIPAWAQHAVGWALFLLPAAVFFGREAQRPGTLEIYENVAQSFPGLALPQYEFGRQLHAAGRLREARTHFDRALLLAPDLLAPHISLGMLQAEQGDLTGGTEELERVLRVDRYNAEAHNDLGVILEEQGRLDEAKTHLQQAVQINSRDPLFHNNLGRVLANLGDLQGSRTQLEQALRIDPRFADAHYQLGSTLAQQGEMAGALRHLNEALAIEPENPDAYSKLGEIAMRQGDLTKATEHFERALDMDPDLYAAHEGLGGVLVSQGKVSEGISHFEEALRIKPDYTKAKDDLDRVRRGNP